MAEKPLPWFRAYPEAAFDPKFDIASRQTGMDNLAVFGAWWKILCIAGSSPVRGSLYVTAMKRYGNDDVAAMLRIGNDLCNALLKVFMELDMLDLDEAGAYRVKNWEKRQFESDNSTKRVKEHRERAKKAQGNADETLHDRYSNNDVTPPDTDTDTDINRATPESENPKGDDEVQYRDPVWDIFHGEMPEGEQNHAPDTEWLPEDTKGLGLAFLTASCLPVPTRSTERGYWIKALRDMRLQGLTAELITASVEKMRADRLIIKSPSSVQAVAMDIKINGNGANVNGNRPMPEGV